jgi:hypothetical protein
MAEFRLHVRVRCYFRILVDFVRCGVLIAPVQEGRVTSASSPPAKQFTIQVDHFDVGIQEMQLRLLRQMYSHFARAKILARYRSIPRPALRTPRSLCVATFLVISSSVLGVNRYVLNAADGSLRMPACCKIWVSQKRH